jgi:YD repeat-containing protein
MPDGSVVTLNSYKSFGGEGAGQWIVLRRIGTDGTVHTLNVLPELGDPVISGLGFVQPWFGTMFRGYEGARLALGSDGRIYVGASGQGSVRIWRLDFADTNVLRATRIAGASGEQMVFGEDIPALDAGLGTWQSCPTCPASIGGLAVAPDGRVFVATTNVVAEAAVDKIFQIGSNGLARTFAGTGERGFSGDGGPAVLARLNRPAGLAVSTDGLVYVADSFNSRVRMVGAGGFIDTIAGTGDLGCAGAACGEGLPAREAFLQPTEDVMVPNTGAFYVLNAKRINFIEGGNGRMRTVAGHLGTFELPAPTGPARTLEIEGGFQLPFGGRASNTIDTYPDGSILLSMSPVHGGTNTAQGQLFRIARQFPGIETSDIFLPSPDGAEFYRFDPRGKHLDTRDAATGAILLTFGYNQAGRLATVTDRAGKITSIEHDATGTPVRIVSPFGQTTTLHVDANGYLSDIVDPLGSIFHSEYSLNGLMTSFTDARGGEQEYTYDDLGRLTSESGPDAASKTFTLNEEPGLRTVTRQTAGGRTASYRYETLTEGDVQRDVTLTGLTATTIQGFDDRITVSADGMMRE